MTYRDLAQGIRKSGIPLLLSYFWINLRLLFICNFLRIAFLGFFPPSPPPDPAISPDPCHWEDSTSPLGNRIRTLRKQLNMELKVKQGAENIIQMYASSSVKVSSSCSTPCALMESTCPCPCSCFRLSALGQCWTLVCFKMFSDLIDRRSDFLLRLGVTLIRVTLVMHVNRGTDLY